MTDVRVGIDLGTCYSSVAYDTGSGIQYLKDPDSPELSYSIPSSALLLEDEQIVFGARAENQMNTRPDCYQREFKRDLGSKIPYQLRDRQVSAAELTTHFVKFLAHATATVAGHAPCGGVITVPVAYDNTRRRLVTEAARRAGLREVSLEYEPLAAIIAAQAEGGVPTEGITLVYDLGGGTFDAALVRFADGTPTVLHAAGLPDFGGSDIDRLIEQDLANKHSRALAKLIAGQGSPDPKLRARALRNKIAVRAKCRRIKVLLSSADTAIEDMSMTLIYELTRTDLEAMVRPHLQRTIVTCRDMVTAARISPDEIDTVLLVGGASRMPSVATVVESELGGPVRRVSDPELAVCRGAALRAHTPEPTTVRTSARKAPVKKAPEKKTTVAKTTTRKRPEAEVAANAVKRQQRPEQTAAKKPAARNGKPKTARPTAPAAAHGIATLTPANRVRSLVQIAPPAPSVSASIPVIDRRWASATVPPILAEFKSVDKFYIPPTPTKKELNARRTTRMPKGEAILGLIDCTLFGSAKDCIVFGEDAIYQAHMNLPGDAWRPVMSVRYKDLAAPLKQVFRLDGAKLTVEQFNKILAAIRLAMSPPTSAHRGPVGPSLDAVYSPDGGSMLGANLAGLEIWPSTLSTDTPRLRLPHSKPVNSGRIDASGRHVASGCDDGTVRLWAGDSGRLRWSHQTGSAVWDVEFSHDGSQLAFGTNAGAVGVLKTSTGTSVCTMKHDGTVTCVKFDPTGQLLATASRDGTARIWLCETANQVATLKHGGSELYAVDFSPDGKALAVGSAGAGAQVWNLATNKISATLALSGVVRSVRFSPDGRMLACATADAATVWDLASKRLVARAAGLSDLWTVAWHPDGSTLVTASAAGVRGWTV